MSDNKLLSLSEALHILYKLSNNFPLSLSSILSNPTKHFRKLCNSYSTEFEKIHALILSIENDFSKLNSLGSKDKATFYFLDSFFGQDTCSFLWRTDEQASIYSSNNQVTQKKLSNSSMKAREEKLLKVIKMDPNRVEGWTALGHCLWEKQDYEASRTSYEHAVSIAESALKALNQKIAKDIQKSSDENTEKTLSLESNDSNFDIVYRQFLKKQSIIAHRELSIVLRRISNYVKDISQVRNLINDSYSHAQKALTLDFTDGESWAIVGNSLLSKFLRSNSILDVDSALQAYTKALSLPHASFNPELQYNRGTVCKFKQLYIQAFNGFKKSIEIDDTFSEANDLENITVMSSKICSLIESQGNMKKKRLTKFIEPIPKNGLTCSHFTSQLKDVRDTLHKQSNDQQIQDKINLTIPSNVLQEFSFKVFQLTNEKADIPLVFISVDRDATFFLFSIYNTDLSAIKDGDIVTVETPEINILSLPLKRGEQKSKDNTIHLEQSFEIYSCINVVVKDPKKILINGKRIYEDQVLTPTLTLNSK